MTVDPTKPGRSLLVLADGVHAAFAAGALAALARGGASWTRGAGGGLGAHAALLAVLGESAEAERRWSREAALGCPLFESRLGEARRRLGAEGGLTVVSDPWSLDGWLDPAGLEEHLAPESAAVPERLGRRGTSLAVAVEDVTAGSVEWLELGALEAGEAGVALRAAAAFPAGWGPHTAEWRGASRSLWGGVAPALRCGPPWRGSGGEWDVVCGFPVPAVRRPALGAALLEQVQRRGEATAAEVVARWVARAAPGAVRLIAPAATAWRAWSRRDDADLGVEYPLPWERNAELTGSLLRFGAFSAESADEGGGP